MSYEITEHDMKIIRKIQKVTCTKYEFKNKGDNAEILTYVLEDLWDEYVHLQEKVKELEEEIEENYKPSNPYADLGLRESDFY